MKPTATVAAVVSGLTMFAVGLVMAGTSVFGARAASGEALPAIPDSPVIGAPLAEAETFRQPRAPRPRRVSRTVSAPAPYPAERVVVAEQPAPTAEQPAPTRSWKKTAVIVGGSAASGAAVGAIVDGKKGALIGAAIGGGAASVYEVIRRR